MPEVVCNTSPLQYLHQIGELAILPALYGRIHVPMAVVEEIRTGIAAGVDLPDLTKSAWLEARDVAPTPWPLPRDIHRGEAEVIALAGNFTDPVVILDDLAARKHAQLLGLRVTGTLGVLLKAKQAGHLTRLAPLADRLALAGFRMAESTRAEFLKLAGE